MADIIVDTYKLKQYAQCLSTINLKIAKLDSRLDRLYTKVGLLDLWDLVQADLLTGYSWRLNRCVSYLNQTAVDFETIEKQIANTDLSQFEVNGGGSSQGSTYNEADIEAIKQEIQKILSSGGSVAIDTLNAIKDEISGFPEDINSAGEFLSFIEDYYDELPYWFTHGVDAFVPDTLQEAYTLTSGIFQGDLTLEEGWEVASDVISQTFTLSIICETINYFVYEVPEIDAEMNEQIYEQLQEGDILGVVLEGAEGFVDGVLGGSVEIIGNAGGTMVDNYIDNIPGAGIINDAIEYGTGFLGWNDGDGYSVGGMIGATTGAISDGVDVATDVVTDLYEMGSDFVGETISNGIEFVGSWFD